jgi:prepilin signal peptidase PulO-like enzyme (type II secretory pathway)
LCKVCDTVYICASKFPYLFKLVACEATCTLFEASRSGLYNSVCLEDLVIYLYMYILHDSAIVLTIAMKVFLTSIKICFAG